MVGTPSAEQLATLFSLIILWLMPPSCRQAFQPSFYPTNVGRVQGNAESVTYTDFKEYVSQDLKFKSVVFVRLFFSQEM
jgi:hypothetical protein